MIKKGENMSISNSYKTYIMQKNRDFDRLNDIRKSALVKMYIKDYIEEVIVPELESSYQHDEIKSAYRDILRQRASLIINSEKEEVVEAIESKIIENRNLYQDILETQQKIDQTELFLDDLISRYDTLSNENDIISLSTYNSNNEFIASIVETEKDHVRVLGTITRGIYKDCLEKYKSEISSHNNYIKYKDYFGKQITPPIERFAKALDYILSLLIGLNNPTTPSATPSATSTTPPVALPSGSTTPSSHSSSGSTSSGTSRTTRRAAVDLVGYDPISGSLVNILEKVGQSGWQNVNSNCRVSPSQLIVYDNSSTNTSTPPNASARGITFHIVDNNGSNNNITIYQKGDWFLFRKRDETIPQLVQDNLDDYLNDYLNEHLDNFLTIEDLLKDIRLTDKNNVVYGHKYLFMSASELIGYEDLKELYQIYKVLRDNISDSSIIDITQYVRRMISTFETTQNNTIKKGKGYRIRNRSPILERIMLRDEFVGYMDGKRDEQTTQVMKDRFTIKDAGQYRILGNRNEGIVNIHGNDSDPLHAAMNILEFLYQLDKKIYNNIANLDFLKEYYMTRSGGIIRLSESTG